MEHENVNSQYTVKIGKTTYLVCIKQAENAKKSLESTFRDICKHEVFGTFSTATSHNLEQISKKS